MRWMLFAAVPLLAAGIVFANDDLYLADHALVGTIVRSSDGTPVDRGELEAALLGADFVLLGEKHDNARHHAIQAELVERLGADGRLDAVAFEMFGRHLQLPITLHFQEGGSAAALATAVAWDDLGWGSWTWYGPIVHAARRHDATVVAADLSRDDIRAVYEDGFGYFDPGFVTRTGLDVPLSEEDRAARETAMVEAHCGHALGEQAGAMVAVQRARDAMMADRLATLVGDGQGILITGNGHADTRTAVPTVLTRLEPEATVVSVGLIEVEPDWRSVPDERFGFDYVWFTPRAKPADFDYCDQFNASRG